MKITPSQLHQKTFKKSLIGYDPSEVENYLEQVATYLEELLIEKNALQESLREKDLRLAEYKEREQKLQTTIHSAAQMAEKMRDDAQREAKLILQDAEQKAEMIVRDAKENLKKMYQEIHDLKRIRMQFESSFRALMNAHMNLIEEGSRIFQNFEERPLGGISGNA